MSLRKAGEAGEAGEAGGEKSIFYDFALREYIYVFVSPSTPRFPSSPSLPQQIKLNKRAIRASVFVPPMPYERLALDGKGIRCTVTDYSQSYQNFISTVSVYSHGRGIVLRMQPMSNKKISEVAIVQQLICEFSGQQVMFTLDALHCQKKQYR